MDLTLFLLLLGLTGILAGLVGSLTGLGGAVVVIPVLIIGFDTSFPVATGAGLITILATSSTTGSAYVRDRLTDLRVGMFFEIVTVPGAILGATATVLLAHANLSNALLIALGFVFLAILPGSVRRRNEELPRGVVQDGRSKRLGLTGSYFDQASGQQVEYAAARTTPALGVMFGAGFVSGMFGIGAGVFKVLALDHYLQLPMKISTATSNFMMGVTAAAGAGVLLAAGYVNPFVAAPAAMGTALGAYLGASLLPGLKNRTVRYIGVPIIAVIAVETILRGLGLP